jgi:Flp pilus assembly protein TadG
MVVSLRRNMFRRKPARYFRRQPKKLLRTNGAARMGIATVETAICLPMVIFITFGSIELSNLLFLRQTLTIASYEAARAATKPGGSEGLGTTKAGEVLLARGVSTYSVTYTPNVTTSTPRGTLIRATVSTATSNLTYAPFRLFSGSAISSSTAMVHQ